MVNSRTYTIVTILTISGLLVAGCTTKEEKNTPEISISTKTSVNQSPVSQPESTQPNKKSSDLCITKLSDVDHTWPVGPVMREWNERPDGLKLSLPTSTADCFAMVLLTSKVVESWPQSLGYTEFEKNGYDVYVTVSPITPTQHRKHVLCHELGHVLGRGHTSDPDSCMNISLTVDHPSALDLQEAGKNYWQYH